MRRRNEEERQIKKGKKKENIFHNGKRNIECG
jgi:hypothetical protein